MSVFNVELYTKPDGEKPVREFLLSLNPKMRAKMLREIELLENNGPKLREPDSKPLGEGIFELRAKFSNEITRVLYFFFAGKNIILTNGFAKKTPKTPPSEIETAKKYRAEYLRRKELSK